MSLDDYMEHFSATNVALYQPYNGYSQGDIKDAFESAQRVAYKFTNPTKQYVYFVAEKYAGRLYPRAGKFTPQ